jgi:tRNA nucleotidyltransferase (CCA-adding enzyme)
MTKRLPIIDQSQTFPLPTPFVVSPQLNLLLDHIKQAGGRAILVGGCVRDHLLQHTAQDIDIEIYGIDATTLESLLTKHFSVVAVGKTFGIFKVSVSVNGEKQSFDVALPRTENKEGQGHKGFVISTNPHMSFTQASSRRDFTINAMGIDPEAQVLLDPHHGQQHLLKRHLQHVSNAFSEDPLRVLRAAQFCARFDLILDKKTVDLCRSLEEELKTLSNERIYGEMKKLLLSKKPSLGLLVLRQTNALNLFPELVNLIDCPQDAEWHPEGDVWIHSLMVTDQAAMLTSRLDLSEDDHLVVIAGALCHDLGKPKTTVPKDGRIKSPGHEQAGEEPTRTFLTAMGMPQKLHDAVVSLVKEHLKPHQLYRTRDEVSDGAIRRLASRVDIKKLLLVSQADFLGRTTPDALAGHDPSAPWLTQKVLDLVGKDLSPKPILQGRHLIVIGQKPGHHFADILREAFEAQMDGEFNDEESAMAWLKKRLK